MKLNKIVIIGTGLIGGSVGKAIIKRRLAKEVVGVCRRKSTLKRGIREKAFTRGFVNNYEKAVSGADVILIATPVHTIRKVLEKLAVAGVPEGALVTDAGSTKKEIVKYAARFRKRFRFIGGHPLAGSEKKGVEYSSSDLFEGSVWFLTPDKVRAGSGVKKLKRLWEALGAHVVELTPAKHDEYLAFSSHLPHIAAYALAGALGKGVPRKMIGTGFKDTTRIASSDAMLWSDIFLSNRGNILKAVKRYKKVLSDIEKNIRKNDEKSLKRELKTCKKVRDEIL